MQWLADGKIGGKLPQYSFDGPQPAREGRGQFGDGMNPAKDVLYGNCHRGADHHGKSHPQRVFGALINREVGFIPKRDHRGQGKAEVNSRGVIRHDVDKVKRQEKRDRDPQKVSERIVDHGHNSHDAVHGGDNVDHRQPNSGTKGYRKILAAEENRENGAEESVWDTEGHHQDHGDSGGHGDAGHDPGAARVGRKLGLEKLPEPGAGIIKCVRRRNRRKFLFLG